MSPSSSSSRASPSVGQSSTCDDPTPISSCLTSSSPSPVVDGGLEDKPSGIAVDSTGAPRDFDVAAWIEGLTWLELAPRGLPRAVTPAERTRAIPGMPGGGLTGGGGSTRGIREAGGRMLSWLHKLLVSCISVIVDDDPCSTSPPLSRVPIKRPPPAVDGAPSGPEIGMHVFSSSKMSSLSKPP
ncbi:hypothetical protein GGH92_010562 [Coemansia sp. RSA 2673]|nr:hypothetical protein GGH92_010562 [Coemansia sp. RSA 2673]